MLEFLIVIWLLCAIFGAVIAQQKGRSGVEGFFLGALLGLIGVAIVALLPSEKNLPPVPLGMRSLQCVRCNATQNVPTADYSYECWQCHQINGTGVPIPTRSLQCPKCQHTERVPVTSGRYDCSACHANIKAPALQRDNSPAMPLKPIPLLAAGRPRVVCPECGTKLELHSATAMSFRCVKCKTVSHVPV
jgi:DNA-directed RNA polymerase subunit RPC12/RpoP